jgi:hypothetical protein
MSTDPVQQQMIRDAMKSIAERKPGRSKLVYDKTKRTIVAVAEGSQAPQALNITADDADMFATVTLSSDWLREHWQKLKDNGSVPVQFSSWDGGDALTQNALCVTPSPTSVDSVLFFGKEAARDFDKLAVFLTASQASASRLDNFSSPSGELYAAKVWDGKGWMNPLR